MPVLLLAGRGNENPIAYLHSLVASAHGPNFISTYKRQIPGWEMRKENQKKNREKRNYFQGNTIGTLRNNTPVILTPVPFFSF